MIPIPCSRVCIKRAYMEPHPCSSVLHVLLKCSTLGNWRCIIEKEYNLVLSKKTRIEVTPIVGSLIREIMLSCDLGEPDICLFYETDMGGIPGSIIKRNDFKSGSALSGRLIVDTYTNNED